MNDEIRLHLSARRPGGQDDADTAIAQALAKAATDPALVAWSEAEQRSDAALADKLRQVQPPPGLRDTILAGARVSRRRWWNWFNTRAWRSFRMNELIAAAAIILIIAVAVSWNYFGGANPVTDWQTTAAVEVARIEANQVPEKVMDSMPAIQTWLATQTCPTPGDLPAPVRNLKIYGCTKVMWGSEPMSVVCFFLDGAPRIHLVTVSRLKLPSAPPEKSPIFCQVNGYHTACWSDGDRSMMLIGKVEEEELRKLMGVKEEESAVLRRATDHLVIN
jgi:hypothetical protein